MCLEELREDDPYIVGFAKYDVVICFLELCVEQKLEPNKKCGLFVISKIFDANPQEKMYGK